MCLDQNLQCKNCRFWGLIGMPLGVSSLPSDKWSASERDYTHVAVRLTMCIDVCFDFKCLGTYICIYNFTVTLILQHVVVFNACTHA